MELVKKHFNGITGIVVNPRCSGYGSQASNGPQKLQQGKAAWLLGVPSCIIHSNVDLAVVRQWDLNMAIE